MSLCVALPVINVFDIKHAQIQKIFSGGGGGGVKIPRRGLTENFNMAKLIIWQF